MMNLSRNLFETMLNIESLTPSSDNKTADRNTTFSGFKSKELSYKVKLGFNILFLVLGVAGNLFVVIFNTRKIKKEQGTDSVHAFEYFICQLGVSDLAFVSMCFIDLYSSLPRSTFYCKFVSSFLTVTLIVSMYTVTVIALFRCRAIINPFKPKPREKTIYLTICVVWVLAVIDTVPYSIVMIESNGECTEVWTTQTLNKIYTIVLLLVQYIVPLMIMVISYVKIIRYLKRHRIPQSGLSKDVAQQMTSKRKRDIKVIKISATIVLLYGLLTLPLQVGWMTFVVFEYRDDVVSKFSSQLLLLHSCCNPFVYGTISRDFRSQLIRVFSNIFNFVFRRNKVRTAVIFEGARASILP